MMEKRTKVMQGIASALLLVALGFGIWKTLGFDKLRSPHILQIGRRLPIQGFDWASNRLTLIVAVRPGCPWCLASAPLYRDLQHLNSSRSFHLTFIAQEPVESTREYIHSLKIDCDDVRQEDFAQLGIEATPTVVLVGVSGKVEKKWIGYLPPESQRDLYHALHANYGKEIADNASKGQGTTDVTQHQKRP